LDLFKSFDLNHDGLLSLEELQQGMASLGETFSREETLQVIARADRDGNKMIDFAEFKSMMGV
jgi:Ca2+-binding EF-hand superfamily protein